MLVNGKNYRTVWWNGDSVGMIDQTILPHKFQAVKFAKHEDVAGAIRDMVIMGAPAIGAAGAFGMALAAMQAPDSGFEAYVKKAARTLRGARPTAQDLSFGVGRVLDETLRQEYTDDARKAAAVEASLYADESAQACERIGKEGNRLIKSGMRLNTHCNAGWLATVDWGTALSPIFRANRDHKKIFVYVDETRPRLQGLLTSWELLNEKIPHAVIADNAAGHFMAKGEIDMVIVGADRIAMNGDVANKIGTYSSAVVAHENRIPFYVAAPLSTVDMKCKSGKEIPIEERGEDEVLFVRGLGKSGIETVRVAPKGSTAKNPAFDITPAKFITGIITEKGIVEADRQSMKSLFFE